MAAARSTLCCLVMTLTHSGRVAHICVGNLTIIGSNNGLSPDRRQAIIWTNAGISLIGPYGANFSEILIEILTFPLKNAFENVVCEMTAILSRPQWVNCVMWMSHVYSHIMQEFNCWVFWIINHPLDPCERGYSTLDYLSSLVDRVV